MEEEQEVAVNGRPEPPAKVVSLDKLGMKGSLEERIVDLLKKKAEREAKEQEAK